MYFVQPKTKSRIVRFIINFIDLNNKLHPMPKIKEMFLNLKTYKYNTSLDLNMGNHHIQISKNTSNPSTTTFPWVKYRCKLLPKGVIKFSCILQEKMNEMFQGFEYI